MQVLRRLRPAAVVLVLGFVAGPARAWDRDTHVAIVNAALRLSPAAAARIPAGQRSALTQAAAEADMLDRECRYHPTGAGPKAPQAQADRAFEWLRSRKDLERPYLRAQSIGRYLHYVADSAMSADLASQERPYPASDLFSNRNFVVFYEGRALTLPLAGSLLERGREARWGDPGEGSLTTAFRVAANLTVEALLLLPPESGVTVSDAAGPALFLVNTIDTGIGVKKVGEKYLGSTTEKNPVGYGGTVVWDHYEEYLQIDPSSGRGPFLFSEKAGLHILEWNPRTSGATAMIRVLLFNNDDTCATKIILRNEKWQKPLPIRIGPRGVRIAEFEGPAGLSPEGMLRTWTPEPCTGAVEPGSSFPTGRRVIVGLKGQAPAFDERETRVGPGDPPKASLAGMAGQMKLRDADAAVKQNQTLFGKMKIGGREVSLDGSEPFFGKDSVARQLHLSSFLADATGCPGTRARVYGSVKNISRLKLRGLKALVLIGSLRSSEHNGQVQSMNPSDLMPGEESEVFLWLSCDWAEKVTSSNLTKSENVLVVLADVAGRTEEVARPDGTNPFETPAPRRTAAPARKPTPASPLGNAPLNPR